jgi:hypothetical protein
MPVNGPSPGPSPEEDAAARRRKKAADVFGDVLPESTRDDRGDSWGERGGGDGDDDWLRRQVPPHHG